MTIAAQESWTGTNGAAWTSTWWSTGGTGTIDIQSNAGRVLVGSTTAFAVGPYAFLTGAPAVSDYSLTVDVYIDTLTSKYISISMGTTAGQLSSGTQASNGYTIELAPGAGNYTVNRHVSATRTTLSTQSHTYTAASWVRVNLTKAGSVISATVWDGQGTAKPGTADYSATDGSPFNTATKPQVCVGNGSTTAAMTATFDNLLFEVTGAIQVATSTIVAGNVGVPVAFPSPVGGLMVGDLLLMSVTSKGSASTHPTISGWTKQVDLVHGVGTTVGAGTGPQRQSLWTKISDGTETGTVSVTPAGTASNMALGGMAAYRSNTGAFDLDYASGSTSTTATTAFSVTADHNQTLAAGDVEFFALAASANTNFGSSTVNATGITFGGATERTDIGTANGDDGRLSLNDRPATAGTSSASTIATSTAGAATYGGAIFVRIREGVAALTGAATVTTTAAITAAGAVGKSSAATVAVTASITASATLPVSALSDTFTGTTIDTAKWAATAGITQSGTLTIPCASAYPALSSVSKYTLTGSGASVQVVQTAGPGTGTCETLFILELDGSNHVRMERVGGSMAYGYRTAGSDTMSYPSWNASLYKWWRISESGGTVTFAGSSTGAAWTTIGTISTPAWATAPLTVSLKSGYYGTESSPQPAIYDNLNVAPTMPTTTNGTIHSGVWAPDPEASTATWQANLNTFDTDAGKRPDLNVFYQQWSGTPAFPTSYCNIIHGRGQVPVITWEPWLYTGGATQSTYSLANIIAGNFDSYITTWALAAKAYSRNVYLRFAHEMNGNWYPWCEGVNGNTTGQYASAWQHVRDIFTANGVTNVQWVWCPNEPYSGSTALTGLYPGSSYVDVLGVDGYAKDADWRSFDALMAPAIDQIRALDATHPLWVVETGAVETGGSKSAWIADMFTTLKYRTEITGLAWWNDAVGGNSYSIETSGPATAAYAAGIADPRYIAAGGTTAVTTTATVTTAGVVGKSTGATVPVTAAVTAAGITGRSTTAAVAATATVSTTGTVGAASGSALTATAGITATGTMAAAGGATVGTTAGVTAAGVVGKSTGATVTSTAGVTASGLVATSTGSAVATTATITAAGVVSRGSTATLSVSAAVTATGAVTAAGSGNASINTTAGITAAGTVSAGQTATLTTNATITTAGVVGKPSPATISTTAGITATGTVATGSGATVPVTVGVTAAGVRGTTTDAMVTGTATITAAGAVTTGSTAAVSIAAAATITASGQVSATTATTLTVAAGITTTGSVTTATAANLPIAAAILATGTVATGTTSTTTITATITATGHVTGPDDFNPGPMNFTGPTIYHLSFTGPLLEQTNLVGPLLESLAFTGPEVY